MGTPEFAVPSLAEIIANGYNVKRVYTQPAESLVVAKKLQNLQYINLQKLWVSPLKPQKSSMIPRLSKNLKIYRLMYAALLPTDKFYQKKHLEVY